MAFRRQHQKYNYLMKKFQQHRKKDYIIKEKFAI